MKTWVAVCHVPVAPIRHSNHAKSMPAAAAACRETVVAEWAPLLGLIKTPDPVPKECSVQMLASPELDRPRTFRLVQPSIGIATADAVADPLPLAVKCDWASPLRVHSSWTAPGLVKVHVIVAAGRVAYQRWSAVPGHEIAGGSGWS